METSVRSGYCFDHVVLKVSNMIEFSAAEKLNLIRLFSVRFWRNSMKNNRLSAAPGIFRLVENRLECVLSWRYSIRQLDLMIYRLDLTYRTNLSCVSFFQLRVIGFLLLLGFDSIVLSLLVLRLACRLEVTPVLEFPLLFLESRPIFLDGYLDFGVSLFFLILLLFPEKCRKGIRLLIFTCLDR